MLRRGMAIASLLLFASSFAFAQSTGGRILGRVSDPSSAAVPGATVMLTNEATGVTTSTTTNEAGDFSFPTVPVGSYTVTVTREGFKQNVRKNVALDLNQVLSVDTVMQVGGKEEVVTVTAEVPLVDTTSTQLGAVMGDKTVVGLPLNSRDTYQLLQLQPGVQGTGGADLFYGSNTSGAVSVNGGRGRTNNFSVNGGDGNDLFVNSPAIQPSPDSIQEFRVLSNTFDAEYGRNSGAVINVVTKSGTNQWHGSVYEFFRNEVLDARGYLDPHRPDDKQNQFGATFGGPIKKDRTFFFLSYDGRQVVQGITSDPTVVPTAAERNGDFSATPFTGSLGTDALAQILQNRPGCATAIAGAGGAAPAVGTPWASIFPNSQVPTACFDPVATSLMNLYVPCPNADPTCSNLTPGAPNIFQSIPNDHSHANQFTIKLDHKINDRQNFSAYYYFNDSFDAQPFTRFQAPIANLLPGFGNDNAFRNQQVNLSHTWTINNSLVNEARFTYFREAQGTFLHPQRTDLVTNSCGNQPGAPFCFTGTTDTPTVIIPGRSLGITPGLGPNHEGVPFIGISGGFTIGNDFEGELPQIGNTYQVSDNLTKVYGNHTMKFGVDFRNQRFFQTLFFDPQGDFSYFGGGPNDFGSNIFANYLFGIPDSYLQGSTNSEDVRGNAFYVFAQDSWKVRPNLTVNYGLRWEYNQPFYDAGNRYQTFRPGQATTTYPCVLSPTNPLNPTFGTNNPLPSSCAPGSANEAYFPLGLVVPDDKGVPQGLTDTYWKSFAPRIGVAWDPWKNGKTTIRAGFGIFYNPVEQLVLEQFQAEPPFGVSSTVTNGFFSTPWVEQGCTVPCGVGQPGTIPNASGSILNPAPGTNIDWSIFRPILLFGELEPHLRSQYTEQYNLGVQREIARDLVLSVGFVGAQGHRLLATRDINFGNPQTCLDISATMGTGACGPFGADSSYFIPPGTVIAPQGLHLPYNAGSGGTFIPGGTVVGPAGITLVGLRQYSSPLCQPLTGIGCPADGTPVFTSIFAQDTVANSSYNSLQVSLEQRFSHGLQFEAAYTYSKSLDDASSFENSVKPICTSDDLVCNHSYSLYDARHRFVISYYWDLPIPKYSGAKQVFLNGWAVSGITSFQTGFPIRMQSLNDLELENDVSGFEAPGRPEQTAPVHFLDPKSHGGYYFCDPNLPSSCPFQDAPVGSLGGARTICCGPGINNFDFSIQKNTPFHESMNIQFRAEFFNIFNHTQFLNPDGSISDSTPNSAGILVGDFGKVKRTRPPRQVQFALKFNF